MASRLQLSDGVSFLLLANAVDHLLLAVDTPPPTQYVAFSLPQHSLSQVVQKMIGY